MPLLEDAYAAAAPHKSDVTVERLYRSIGQLLANTLDYLGNYARAEVVYQEQLRDDPDGGCVCDYAVFLHRRKRAYDQAETYFVKALALYPNQSSTHLKYAGFLRHVRRDPVAAEKHYVASVTAHPQNSDALGSYASFLHGVTGNMAEAERYYQAALAADDTHANNLCNYGLFLSEVQQRYDEAERCYGRALAVAPTHANTLYNYGVMLDTHLHRKPEAEAMYRRALAEEAKHPFALYNLAVLLEERLQDGGEARLAEEVRSLFQRAIDADPKDANTRADYARFLLSHTTDVDQAEALLHSALKLDPDNALALKIKASLPTSRRR